MKKNQEIVWLEKGDKKVPIPVLPLKKLFGAFQTQDTAEDIQAFFEHEKRIEEKKFRKLGKR
ncbi:hypothetical protein HY572_02400 [Candidatus Micrarchaeota archaeon]|nr:hypothetical protein [Candidatus Micrarchaeota archaeon]